ncbi:MAG TPA: DUF192 domain-containing protein [Dehalococcoidia bacterium]|nr:DUF192 domain-containing protein [Dehalococcoidia bacterium]
MGRLRYGALAAFLALALAACSGDSQFTKLAISTSQGRRVELNVEVPRDTEGMQRGLMGRQSLPEDQGMLFTFPQGQQLGFWMKDTLIPLSAAFIDQDGTIVHIEDMEPLTLTIHNTSRPYRYGLEVNQGWFARHGIGVGDRVSSKGGGPLPLAP